MRPRCNPAAAGRNDGGRPGEATIGTFAVYELAYLDGGVGRRRSPMQTTTQQIRPGWAIYGSDDQKIGDVNELGPNYVLVTKGLIFIKDLYIPFDAITNVDPTRQCAFLDVSKDDVESMGWDQIPCEGEARTTGYAGGPETTDTLTGTDTRTDTRTDEMRAGTTAGSDTVRVPIHEEELQAEKRRDQAGEVEISKRVTEEQQELDVPVTREEVNVRRVSVIRDATDDDRAFAEGDTIRVPVTEEQVDVTKRPRVVEEVEISKRPVTETQHVSDTVRRERVDVNQQGDVRMGSDGDTAGTPVTDRNTGVGRDSEYRADAARDTEDPGERRGEVGADAAGAGAGALGGAAIGGVVGGVVGAAVGGAVGAGVGGAAGEAAEGGDEEAGAGAGGVAGTVAGSAIGGAVGGPPGAVVGGAVGAGAGGGMGDQTEEEAEERG